MTTHNFELSEEQGMIRETVGKFVDDVAGPRALELDEHRGFCGEHREGLAVLGLFGLLVTEARGGMELGFLSYVVAIEELARGCGSTARLVATQAGPCAVALDGAATNAGVLEELVGGTRNSAWIGSDCGISAAAAGDRVVLSGSAELVTGGGEAGCFVVAARLGDEPVLCCVDAAECERTAAESLGFRAAACARVRFDGVEIGPGEIVARGAEAERTIARAELAAWIGGAALAVGMAGASAELARRHADERFAFGKPLIALQAVRHKLVECRRRTAAARHLTYHAARLADAGQDAREAAMLAKLTAVDAAVLAADEGIQIHGGYGYTVEYHVERHYRDAKTLEVVDGTPQMLRDALC